MRKITARYVGSFPFSQNPIGQEVVQKIMQTLASGINAKALDIVEMENEDGYPVYKTTFPSGERYTLMAFGSILTSHGAVASIFGEVNEDGSFFEGRDSKMFLLGPIYTLRDTEDKQESN